MEFKYFCEKCQYKCNYPSEWDEHLESKKHTGEKRKERCDGSHNLCAKRLKAVGPMDQFTMSSGSSGSYYKPILPAPQQLH